MAEIKVRITDDKGSTSKTIVNPHPENNDVTNTKEAKTNKKQSALVSVAMMVGNRSLSYVTSNVGKWTGNSRNQQAVADVQRVTGYAAAFAANWVLGVATVASDVGFTALDYAWERKQQQYAESQAQARTGGKGGYRR